MQNLATSPDRVDSLAEAFAATEYVVDAQNSRDPIVIRIGHTTPVLDRLLDDRPWAVITAHNPNGQRCPEETNAAAQQALEASLRALQPAVLLKVCNRDPAGLWPDEPAWLFTPRGVSRADRLARRFNQRAIVTGLPGAPAALRMYAGFHDAPPGKPPAVVS